ncbi:restriction endonuclease [Salinarimonas sp.]|uniref:restriction endonuclease n=1 Tax=Salinarimonas sp. TaxID=2766526 RepID=UPI0032D97114
MAVGSTTDIAEHVSDRRRAKQFESAIRQLDWPGLFDLYCQIEARETPGWPSGRAFEYLVLRAFELDGAHVEYPFRVTEGRETLEEIDGAFYLDGRAHLVESKDRDANVQIAPIAKLRNQLLRRPAGVVGIVFGRNGFSSPARTLASYGAPQAILLWEGEKVKWLLGQCRQGEAEARLFAKALELKYRHYVERAIPTLDVKEAMA